MNRIKHLLRTYPLFFVGIPLVFLVNAANHYFRLLHWMLFLPTILVYVLCTVPVYFLFYYLFKSKQKAQLFTGFLLIVFYFFSAFHQLLQDSFAGGMAKYSVLLPLILVAAIALFVFLKKKNYDWKGWTYAVNSVVLLLLLAGLLQLGYKAATRAELGHEQADPDKKLLRSYLPCDTCIKPDIYYILLDGYTNSTILREEFGYDNSGIERFLRDSGFHVVTGSRSNYNFTHMSMASVFNLDYLHRLDNSKMFYTKTFLQSYYTMYNNEWCQVLKKEGYEIRNYSIFDIEGSPVKVQPFLKELSYRSVAGQTFFNKLERDIGWKLRGYFPSKKIPAERMDYINDGLLRIEQTLGGVKAEASAAAGGPRFVYAHFLLPHETFYFDSTGQRLPVEYTAVASLNKKDYVNQTVYVNKFVIAPLVNEILRHRTRPVVIIIQGDHGYRNYPAEKVDLEFGNFNAIYFPRGDYRAFDSTKTSVNTFRIVLNNYFNKRLCLLKDSSINLMKKKSLP
jgi:ribosomal protein S8